MGKKVVHFADGVGRNVKAAKREMTVVIHGRRAVGKTVLQYRLARLLDEAGYSVNLLDEGKVYRFFKKHAPREMPLTEPVSVTIDTTCGEYDAAPSKPIAEAMVHFDFGADIGTGSCGDDPSRTRTQCLSNVTCLDCLRHKVRLDAEWANHQSAVIAAGRADLEEVRARAKRNGEAAYEASVANEQLERRLHEVMAGMDRATQTGLDASHEAEAVRGKVKDLERDLAAARDDAERVAQAHACMAVELKRWKQAAADLAGAGQSLLSCALVR